ncbi:hypothetical protein BJ165DRAFT_174595 [Panaeolus papilionaceus]|nr:hypothetical protein BJ165DRAFT_174595 [Panaeolus papilionaceus]
MGTKAKSLKKVRFNPVRRVRLPPNVIHKIASIVHEAELKEFNNNERVVVSDYRTFGFEPTLYKTRDDFPYNMARVCRSWWDAIRRVPELWTNFTFNIAEDPARMLFSLRFSQDLPLAVCITTKVENPASRRAIIRSRVTEKRRMEIVLNALEPHLRRCTSIVIRVNWELNLPLLERLILQDSDKLRILICQCRLIESIAPYDRHQTGPNWYVNDTGWSNDHIVHRHDVPLSAYDYDPGKATAMAVTGRQYSDAVLHSPGLFESMACSVDHLALSYFSFEPPIFRRDVIDRACTGEHLLTVRGFFSLLSKLRPRGCAPGLGLYLSFMNTRYIPFAFLDPYEKTETYTSVGMHHPIKHPATFNFISFNTIGGSLFWEMNQCNAISLLSASFARFRNCVLISSFGRGSTLFGLILEEMQDPVSVCYASIYMRYTTAIFNACKGFNDDSSRIIGESRLTRFGFLAATRTREMAEQLQTGIYIIDCDNLTGKEVKSLVDSYTMGNEGDSLLRTVVFKSRSKTGVPSEAIEVLRSLKDVKVDLDNR